MQDRILIEGIRESNVIGEAQEGFLEEGPSEIGLNGVFTLF